MDESVRGMEGTDLSTHPRIQLTRIRSVDYPISLYGGKVPAVVCDQIR
jgi:hypothetical protein